MTSTQNNIEHLLSTVCQTLFEGLSWMNSFMLLNENPMRWALLLQPHFPERNTEA